MEKEWVVKGCQYTDEEIEQFRKDMNGYLETPFVKLLASRVGLDIDKARDFLFPFLKKLYDPFLYNDMDKAIDRLCKAIDANEKIMIYGDYDVDGTTSVALVYSFLRDYYLEQGKDYKSLLNYYVPNRHTEGYGVSYQGVDKAYEKDCALIISLDCGIKDHARIDYAANYGIDFIVCDHHTPGDELPKAVAVLDAKRKDSTYPFDELSGCGVAFKFMQALCIKRKIPFEKLLEYIDLVAVSIGSDIVPIVDENRILAYYGMKKLTESKFECDFKQNGECYFEFEDPNKTMTPERKEKTLEPLICFKKLLEDAGVNNKKMTIYDSVFSIGPRINAVGRMDEKENAMAAVRLLVSKDKKEIDKMAKKISECNEKRKKADGISYKDAIEQLKKEEGRYSSVVCDKDWDKDWDKGVIGIVASKLTEAYYRPTIVFTKKDGKLTGSARSVSDFDLYAAINSCSHYLTTFGGHKFAAGLSLKEENYAAFKNAFEEYVRTHITPEQQKPKIEVEQELDFKSITLDFYNKLKQFEPFGPDNPEPVFATFDVYDYGGTKRIGKDQSHLRLEVVDKSGVSRVGIGFGLGSFCDKIKQDVPFNICYTLSLNEFNGRTSIQLMVKDIKFNYEDGNNEQ